MTQSQHQYSKTATYIVSNVNCVYIYIYLLKLKWKYYCIHNCSYILKNKNQTTESTGSGLCKFISAYRKMQKSFMHHLQQLHMPFTTLDGLIVNQLWVEQPKECCVFPSICLMAGRNERVERKHAKVPIKSRMASQGWPKKERLGHKTCHCLWRGPKNYTIMIATTFMNIQ